MTKFFVWLPGLKAPQPQLWDDLKTEGGKQVKYLACHAVDDKLSLAACIEKYPYEAKE